MRTTWRWRTSVATFYPRSLSTRDGKFVLRPTTLFCKDVFPSNRWKRAQPEIAILTLQTRQKSSTDVRKILTGVWENVAKTAIEKMFSRNYIFTHRCATCNQLSDLMKTNMQTIPRGPKPVWWDIWSDFSHGNEVAYSCDQRLFFSPRRVAPR